MIVFRFFSCLEAIARRLGVQFLFSGQAGAFESEVMQSGEAFLCALLPCFAPLLVAFLLLGARMLLGTPGLTTRSKDAAGTGSPLFHLPLRFLEWAVNQSSKQPSREASNQLTAESLYLHSVPR